ncbi:unnamed protein product [Caenorhabditis bovis]|uniref:Uncharacterized protein n=1 Tax=Caenorhabditis bovis TaxID=2654633 RepID=A0A8S1EZT2_9PELO|nr:unnamed protein product [Caenorhabditis bovis]
MPLTRASKRSGSARFQKTGHTNVKKARLSVERHDETITNENDENRRETSPEAIIHNLEHIIEEILGESHLPDAVAIELKGFDSSVTTIDEYNEKRNQIRQILGKNTEFFDKKTELHLNEAVIANVKVEVDRKITTRRMSKQFETVCGVQEDEFLYRGLDLRGRESQATKDVSDTRMASIVESVVDFQKQLRWKSNIMDLVKEKSQIIDSEMLPMSDGPCRRTRGGKAEKDKQREETKMRQKLEAKAKKARKLADGDPFKTPQKKVEFNALDERRIIENYALEVASEVRDNCQKNKRPIAPIPFDINILDDDSDEDDCKMELG